MIQPSSVPWAPGNTLGEHLEQRGISRRDFVSYCGKLTAMLGLSSAVAPEIVQALQNLQRPPVIWLQLQECTGCVESVLRTSDPTIGDLVLDVISLDYQHTLMAGAGHAVEEAKRASMEANYGSYVLVVTGSVPVNEGGIYTTVGGRTAQEILEEAAAGAAGIIAVGACAHFGSVQAAYPNPTGARGVDEIIRDKLVVNVAGCPPIADVVTGTIVHFLTFGNMPALDPQGRPMFAYGARIHDQCPRRAHFDAGQFVQAFDDDAARRGWCLYQVGCKGPASFSPCPIFQWNDSAGWPIGAGHPCIGCTEKYFWDTMTPFYNRMPSVAGFGVESRVDLIGGALALGVTAGVGAHAVATAVNRRRKGVPLPVIADPSRLPDLGEPGESPKKPEEE
jgi:hydrogenase small subunit